MGKNKRPKQKRRPPKVPRVKDPKTGKFIPRKEMENLIMADAQNPVMPILTSEEEERIVLEQAEMQRLEDQLIQGNATLDPPQNQEESQEETQPQTPVIPATTPPVEPDMTVQSDVDGETEPGINRQKLIDEADKSLKEMEAATEIQPEPTQEPPYSVEVPVMAKAVSLPETRKATLKREADTSETTSPHPQETNASSQESQGPVPNEVDPNYTKLAEFVKISVNESFCLGHLGSLLSNASVIPHVSHWEIGADLDIAKVIHAMVHQPGFLEATWPVLKVVMGKNISHVQWTATVAVTLAFYNVLKILPQAIHLHSMQRAQQ